MKIDAVIFDVDGTMIDTGNLWIESARTVNKIFGYDKSLEEIKSYIGTGKNDEYGTLVKSVFNDNIKNGNLKSKAGLYSLLNFLKSKKIKTAIASTSNLEKIKNRFASAKIDISYFDQIISGDMITSKKPHPEIYIVACKKLEVLPENAIAIEDSDIGVKSATDAGIKTLLIPDVVKPNNKTVEMSLKVFSSLNLVEDFVCSNQNEQSE